MIITLNWGIPRFILSLATSCLAATAAIAVGPAAGQFNLVCEGQVSTKSFSLEKDEPYRYIYRIDLDRKEWCDGECKALHPVYDVQPTSLQLEHSETDVDLLLNRVDRETGGHMIISTHKDRPHTLMATFIMRWVGQCTRAEFSGFPSFSTKF